ncbi:hypothetical protein D3C71_1598190 [compost metagenome]
MRVGAGIEHHAGQFASRVQAAGLVNPVHQRAFVVALVKAQRKTMALARIGAQLFDIGQRGRAIHSGLARAQQVQVGAIQDKNGFFLHRHAALRGRCACHAGRPECAIMRRPARTVRAPKFPRQKKSGPEGPL